MSEVIDLPAKRNVLARNLFYSERFLVSFSMGIFALFPQYLVEIGSDEVFFGSLSSVGAIFAIIAIVLMPLAYIRFGLRTIAPVGALMYAAGSLGIVLNSSLQEPVLTLYYLCVIVLSIGWSVHFTTGSVCVTAVASEESRAHDFMIYAAFSTLGLSCGPVVASFATAVFGLGTPDIFWLAVASSLIAAAISSWAASLVSDWSSVAMPSLLSMLNRIPQLLRTPVPIFLLLVLMCACIYTTLIHFQITFANSNQLSPETFFLFWALGVVGSRFTVGSFISKRSASLTLSPLFLALALNLVLLSISPGNAILYSASALLLGVTYGLSYPIVQAQAVKFAPADLRTMTQVLFSLMYFLGLYAFPLIAGLLIVDIDYLGLWVSLAGLAFGQAVIVFLTFKLIGAK